MIMFKWIETTVETFRMYTSVSGQLCLQPPSQNPFFLNPHTNSVFLHSHKQPAPFTDIFFASQGCLHTRSTTVVC